MSRQTKIDEMRDVLLRRRDALRQAIRGDDSLLRSFSEQNNGDVVDFACESNNVEISSQLAEACSRELKMVEMALQRILDGTYGVCEACSKNIPLARLQVLPYAALCVQCKIAVEEAGIDPTTVVDWSQIINTDPSSPDLGFNLT